MKKVNLLIVKLTGIHLMTKVERSSGIELAWVTTRITGTLSADRMYNHTLCPGKVLNKKLDQMEYDITLHVPGNQKTIFITKYVVSIQKPLPTIRVKR